MKILNMICLTSLLSWNAFANAELLTLKPGNSTKSGVNISTGADYQMSNQTVSLTNVGSGIRKKFGFDVYVAEILLDNTSQYVKSDAGALPSLKYETVTAVRLNFVRDVPIDKISTSFEEALFKNKVDLDSAPIAGFLKAVKGGGDAAKGSHLTVLVAKNSDGTETVYYESPAGKITPTNGPSGLTLSIFSIWLGTPVDSALADLKKQLLQ